MAAQSSRPNVLPPRNKNPFTSLAPERLALAKALFHDSERMQFIIVTIPTEMAAAESERLAGSLQKQGVPLTTMVVNQVRAHKLGAGPGSCQNCGTGDPLLPLPPRRQVVEPDVRAAFLETRAKDQQRALRLLREEPALQGLQLITAPLLELEVRGLPALEYFGHRVWE